MKIDEEHSIIWRRLDMPGHESTRIYGDGEGWYLDGAAVFLYENQPCRLEYLIQCSPDWRTEFISVDGWVGDEIIEMEIEVDKEGVWLLNGEEISAVKGCIDIDLSFSPVTNTLPLLRMDLAAGESKSTRAAWLRFPSFKLEALDQVYTRIDETTIRYESGSGFKTELRVNEAGIVIDYPDFWIREG